MWWFELDSCVQHHSAGQSDRNAAELLLNSLSDVQAVMLLVWLISNHAALSSSKTLDPDGVPLMSFLSLSVSLLFLKLCHRGGRQRGSLRLVTEYERHISISAAVCHSVSWQLSCLCSWNQAELQGKEGRHAAKKIHKCTLNDLFCHLMPG